VGREDPSLIMANQTQQPSTAQSMAVASGPSLRRWGVLIFVMFLLTSAVGGSLALESTYLPITLASHIGLAIVTLGLAGYATSFVGRLYRAVPRALAGVSALAALGATIAGAAFLLGGQTNAALYAMEGLGVLGILASLVLIVVGGPSGKRAPAG
jgi:hypothetical protein